MPFCIRTFFVAPNRPLVVTFLCGYLKKPENKNLSGGGFVNRLSYSDPYRCLFNESVGNEEKFVPESKLLVHSRTP